MHSVNNRHVIEHTADGSPTLRCAETGQTFHSANGAMTESMHVFINAGYKACSGYELNILEVGFGTGLNAYLTMKEAAKDGRKVHYTGVELYPPAFDLLREMKYAQDELFLRLHEAEWGREVAVTPYFNLTKINSDFTQTSLNGNYDLVYFDAFAPTVQPGMWSAELFSNIYHKMNMNGHLVTYSAKGDVKRALREAGFIVRRLQGAPGKHHMLRADKTIIDVCVL